MNVRSFFITYILPGITVLLIQFVAVGMMFGAGLACGGSGGPTGCDGLVLATYLIVSAPITGFGIILLFTGNWQRALKFLLAIYAIEIAPFLLTGNLGDVFKNLTLSLPSYAKLSYYPYFFWDITLPILLFVVSPILFGGLSTVFRQKKYLIIIGLAWTLVVLGYFVVNISISFQRAEAEQTKELSQIKSSFPIREPTYLPDFMKKINEYPSASDGIRIEYQGCLSISQYPGPFKFSETLLSSEKFIDINGTKAQLQNEKSIYHVRFGYSGVHFEVNYSHEGDCSKFPLLSEEEFLKIVRSMING